MSNCDPCTQQGPAPSPRGCAVRGRLCTRGTRRRARPQPQPRQAVAGRELRACCVPGRRPGALHLECSPRHKPGRCAQLTAELGWAARGTEAAPTPEAPELNFLLSLVLKIATRRLSCDTPHTRSFTRRARELGQAVSKARSTRPPSAVTSAQTGSFPTSPRTGGPPRAQPRSRRSRHSSTGTSRQSRADAGRKARVGPGNLL